nr:DUF3871 family protein [Flavobacterium sp. LS1P28]
MELKSKIYELINNYKKKEHLENMQRMFRYSLTEIQFAHLIGKMKLFPYLSKEEKHNLFPLSMNDTQLNIVVRDYHTDAHFSKSKNNTISFWNLYNLFTEANKSSYIDSILERNLNSYAHVNYLLNAIEKEESSYFIH